MYTEKRNLLALASPDASDSESIQRALIVFSEWMGPAALNTRYKTPIIIVEEEEDHQNHQRWIFVVVLLKLFLNAHFDEFVVTTNWL